MRVIRKKLEGWGFRVAGDDEIAPTNHPVCHVVRTYGDMERLCPGYPEEGKKFCPMHEGTKEARA